MKIANLKELRESKNISQKDLAEMIGKTASFVSFVENGKSGVSEETVNALCNALEVSIDELTSIDEICIEEDKTSGLLKLRDLLSTASPVALKNINTMLEIANQHRIRNHEIRIIIKYLMGGKND